MTLSNNLIQRINHVKEAGCSYKNANMLTDRKKEIENFLDTFKEIIYNFKKTYSDYIRLKKVCDISVDFGDIKNCLEQLHQKINANCYDKSILSLLKEKINVISNEINKAWTQYVTNETSAINGLLNSISAFIEQFPEKQELEKKHSLFKDANPGSPAAINAIKEYVVIGRSLIEKLGLRDDVVAFIKRLTTEKNVNITDLNEDVYKWLRSSSFAKKIKISIS